MNGQSSYSKVGVYRGFHTKQVVNKGDRHPTTILECKNAPTKGQQKAVHKTQKPVDLCEWLIKSYSNEGDLVMDFCMGSGTTFVACKNTGRSFIGVEKYPEIFKVAYCREKIKSIVKLK